MNIVSVYKTFPTQAACIAHLEQVRWNGTPVCPYCNSTNCTTLPKENRHHCNTCNTTFSVTVGTIFHKTKIDLQKWFLAIALTLNAKKGISARQLGRDIEVTKDTAWRILMQIRKSFVDDNELLEGIVEIDETFIGGKNKNRHASKKVEGGQGGNGGDKTIVVGTLQRDGKVKAQKVKDRTAKTLHGVIKQNVATGTQLMTDEFKSYNGLCLLYGHSIVNHSMKEYVNGACHTNTLEGFWSLLKRGVIGQYHYVSPRYLNNYINEFCYRYNSRKTATKEVFAAVVSKGLSIR